MTQSYSLTFATQTSHTIPGIMHPTPADRLNGPHRSTQVRGTLVDAMSATTQENHRCCKPVRPGALIAQGARDLDWSLSLPAAVLELVTQAGTG